MHKHIAKLAVTLCTLGLATSTAFAGYSYSSTKAGQFRRAAMAVRMKNPGKVQRAVTAGKTESGKSWVVNAAMRNGEIHKFTVTRKAGAVTDHGNVLPRARKQVAFRTKFVEGMTGFKVSSTLAPHTRTVQVDPLLSTHGAVIRLGIEKNGRVHQNRLYNIRTGKVTGDSTDSAYSPR